MPYRLFLSSLLLSAWAELFVDTVSNMFLFLLISHFSILLQRIIPLNAFLLEILLLMLIDNFLFCFSYSVITISYKSFINYRTANPFFRQSCCTFPLLAVVVTFLNLEPLLFSFIYVFLYKFFLLLFLIFNILFFVFVFFFYTSYKNLFMLLF